MNAVLLYSALTTFFLLIFLITTLVNLPLFPKLRPPLTPTKESTAVSILIPARNEAAVIGQTIELILAQTVPDFELLLLDDGSTDGTADLARQAAAKDDRLRILTGQPLPAGWLGKNWACHQLSQAAQGKHLLFIDADVRWSPPALAALLHLQHSTQADLLTIWPSQITESWAERLVVPLMKFAILSYLPIIGVHHTPWSIFAAANGQCLLFTRQAYEQIGGHAAVRNQIVEDVQLARHIKQNRLRLRMADGNQIIACRMYDSWAAVRSGFGKNILAGHANSVPFLLLSTLAHWSMFVWPWLWLLLGGGWLALGMIALGLLNRLLIGLFVSRGWMALLEAFLMPLSVILMTRIAWQSLRWHFGEGPQWKGRIAQN